LCGWQTGVYTKLTSAAAAAVPTTTQGYENADKCAWTFGDTYSVGTSGAKANVNLAGQDYLIQRVSPV
jgi:hypothetical protein